MLKPRKLARRLSFCLLLIAATMSLLQDSANCQTVAAAPTSQPASPCPPSDILIVQLAKDADREKFDQLLKESNGKLVNTICAGSTLKFLVVQCEAGKAGETEKRLRKSNEVSLVSRNHTYRIDHETFEPAYINGPTAAGHGTAHGTGSSRFRSFRSSRSIIPSDRFFFSEWDLAFMQYVPARSLNLGSGVPLTFYFLDTGYAPSIDSPFLVAQYNFADPVNPTGAREFVFDTGFHGTATATVLATTNNKIGYAGMANFQGNRCILVECRISSDGESSDLVNILAALSSLAQSSGLTPGPINLSFNASPPNTLNADPMVQQVAQQLRQEGFLLVLASGNDGAVDSSPEKYARRVASINLTGNLSSFSNTGNFPAAAPGELVPIYTTLGPGREAFASGTSFSAPRWCAAIALVMSVLSPANRNAAFADNILLQSGTQNPQGYVIPNLRAALQTAQGQ
jgi:hypothetical protein